MSRLVKTAALGLACVLIAPVHAETLRISSGSKGLTYSSVYTKNLLAMAQEQKLEAQEIFSAGSQQNIERILAGQADIGFTQADILALYLDKHPQASQKIGLGGELTSECVYLVASKQSSLKDEDDIGKNTKLAIGEKGSGSVGSWQYLVRLEDDYREASVYYEGGLSALTKVISGQYDGFVWVSAPNQDNKYLQAINANADKLRMISLDDYSLNNKLPNGKSVYEFQKSTYNSQGLFDKEVVAPCTSTLIIGDASNQTAMEFIQEATLINKQRILSK